MISRRRFIGTAAALGGCVAWPSLASKQRTIRIVYSMGFVPMSYFDANNIMVGFYVELFDAILGERMGFSVEHIGLPWKRAQLTVENAEADAFCTNATDGRRAYMNFCEIPIIENRRVVLFHKGHPLDTGEGTPVDVDELKPFPHVSYIGNGWAKQNLAGFDIHWAPDSTSAVKVVAGKRAEVFVTGEYQARYRTKLLGFGDRLRFRPILVEKPSLHRFGLRKSFPDSRRTVDEFCQHLREFKDEGGFSSLLAKFI